MILPKKQLSINESYFGFGAFLLEKLTEPISVEDLWEYYKDSCLLYTSPSPRDA